MPVIGKSVALFDHFNYKGEDDFYVSNPLPSEDSFYNPILPGWYSDPSICTNGEGDYFLATSTFSYFPGVPLFHSKDLVNWKQVSNILNRPSQLMNMKGQHVSGGIFAPAIEYNPHNKTYYMITTNVGAGLHIAWSVDRENWHGIGPEFRFLGSDFGTWGSQKKMINPFLFQDKNGLFHCLWTLNNETGQFAHAASDDLFNWKRQSYPEVLENGNITALEASFDSDKKTYLIA